jgi:hypothetical protein
MSENGAVWRAVQRMRARGKEERPASGGAEKGEDQAPKQAVKDEEG